MRSGRSLPTKYRQELVIGVKEFDGETGQFVIRPHFVADSDASANAWRLIEDPATLANLYPPRGFVGIPPRHADEPSPALLQVVAQRRPYRKNDAESTDLWVARIALPVRQIIDLQPFADRIDGKRQLMSDRGVELAEPPLEHVLLQVDSQRYVGPFSLERVPDTEGQYRIPERQLDAHIQVWKGDARAAEIIWDDKKRSVEGPHAQLSELEFWDWRPDVAFLSDAIATLVNQTLPTTDPALLQATEQALIGAASKVLTPAQHKRLGDMIDQRRVSEAQLREIASRIRGSALGEEIIKELIGDDLQRARQRMQSELEDEFAARRSQLEQNFAEQQDLILAARQDRERILRDLDEGLESRAKTLTTLEQRVHAVESALDNTTGALVDLANSAARVVQDKAVIETLRREIGADVLEQIEDLITTPSPASRSPTTVGHAWTSNPVHPPFVPITEPATRFESLPSFSQSVRDVLHKGGIQQTTVEGLLAAFAERLIPMLAGSRGLDALEAFATQLSHGQLLIVPIHPGTVSMIDLFGRFDERLGRFVPAPNGLADLIVHAEAFDHPVIIVLEGINRIPIEATLLPLLQAYDAPERRPIRAAPRALISAEDPYGNMAEITWPRHLLLAATFVEGPSVFPLPSMWWNFGTFVHAGSKRATLLERSVAPRSVDMPSWRQWVGDVAAKSLRPFEETVDSDSDEIRAVPACLRVAAQRLGRAAEAAESGDYATLTVEQLILPGLVQQNELELAKKINDEYPECRTAVALLETMLTR